MNIMNNYKKQTGGVLITAILMLFLATLAVFLLLNIGRLEQATSGADLRARLSQNVAEAALSQGIEVINGQREIMSDRDNWQLCSSTDTSFPCGAIEPGVANSAWRGSMFRYINVGTVGDFDSDGQANTVFDQRMLPIPTDVDEGRISTVNDQGADEGFPVNYGAGAVMCRVSQTGTTTNCSTDWNEETRISALTIVGVAGLTDEGARATATKTIASYSTFGLTTRQPALMASGTIDLTGSMQIVTNPNAGGVGVPVSVWTRKNVDATGTPDTCYADEFFRLGAKNNSPPTFYPSGADPEDQILTCDDCSCPSGNTLSGFSGSSCGEGYDIVDVDTNSCGVAKDVQPEEFPCDIFQHVFGVAAWTDSNNDYFCETKIMVEDPLRAGIQIGADEAFLRERADFIIKGGTNAAFENTFDASRVVSDSSIGPSTSGIVWDREGSVCDNRTIGSPAAPVLLVVDGEASCQNLKLFGVLFVRATGNSALNPTTGGSATLRLNAGTTIYGSAMVQGMVDKANGTAAIIFNDKVLSNLANNPRNLVVVGMPGAWSDNVRY